MTTRKTLRAGSIAVLFLVCAATAFCHAAIERVDDGIIASVGDSVLKLQVVADDIIRVAFAKDRAFFNHESLSVLPHHDAPKWSFDNNTISTTKFKAQLDPATGAVSFFDASGKSILSEKTRTLTPAIVQGARTMHTRQQWQPSDDESLYGLGQHQLGLMNIKGYDLDLWQHNGTVIVPMLVSSRGYGIFWDNPSFSRFGDLRQFELLKPQQLTASYFADTKFEKLVATRKVDAVEIEPPPSQPPLGPWQNEGQWSRAAHQANTRIHPDLPARGDIGVRWEGVIQPTQTGQHQFQLYSNGGVKLWIDDQLLVDRWRQGWLAWYDLVRLPLEANRSYKLRVEWTKEQGDQIRLAWKAPTSDDSTSLWSEVADGIDYYFVYGPSIDDVIAGYRRLTGAAPMMPAWAFGLWQSRQRYETSQQSLDVVDGFRSRKIPFDNIVQDWFYWPEDQWGSHKFDAKRFPDPDKWVNQIHDRHARVMISVWPKFYPGTENFEQMHSRGYLYERPLADEVRDWVGRGYVYTFYDAFNPDAGKLFWQQIQHELFSKKFDAWWLDATEPDLTRDPTLDGQRGWMHPTAQGPGSRVLNAFALVNSKAVYEGQRAAAADQRVCILTRSAYAGSQRYASATWSGDITSTWSAMRAQIPAGISFSMSGIPYWTMDIGGFAVPGRFARRESVAPEDVDEWRELNTRWFEFGTFVPLLRVHGEFPYREMWQFGGDDSPTFKAQLKFDRLRYRLLPYIYSLAGRVTHEGGTFMRGLVMDFPNDAKVRDVADQYLFGPAFMVSPITTYKARSRQVYLPQASWYDFWTGRQFSGGQTVEGDAPFDAIPLHVRAGSIIPLGPELQYTNDKPADPITLYVYAGADGDFTIYEDDGVSYSYEKGGFSRIPLHWNDAARTLTIGARQGNFPGMLNDRTFEIVLVNKDHPVGFSFDPKPDKTVKYNGEKIDVRLD